MLEYFLIINLYCKKFGVDPALVYAIIKQESNFDPKAKKKEYDSETKKYIGISLGLMQILYPGTTRILNRNLSKNNWYDPKNNLFYGIKHLTGLLKKYPFDKAISSYNAGYPKYNKKKELINLYSYVLPVKRNYEYYRSVIYPGLQSKSILLLGLLMIGAITLGSAWPGSSGR